MSETGQAVEHYRLPVRRWFWLPLGLAGLMVIILMLGLVMISWRSLDRLQPVQAHLAHIGRIEEAGLSLERTLLDGMRGTPIDRRVLAKLRLEILEILAFEGSVHPASHDRLVRIAQRLEHPELLDEYLIAGELSLSGATRPVRGGLAMNAITRMNWSVRLPGTPARSCGWRCFSWHCCRWEAGPLCCCCAAVSSSL